MPALRASLLQVLCATLLALPAITPRSLAQDHAGAAHAFKLTLQSNLQMDVMGTPQPVEAHTELDYTWQSTAQQRRLILDQLSVRSTSNGKVLGDSTLSRTKIKSLEQGQTVELTFAQAPPPVQEMLKDSYGVPIFEMRMDEAGREIDRKITAGPGAAGVLSNGVIANALLFHPFVPNGKTAWETEAEVSLGSGGYVKGKLAYQKLDRPGVIYSVTGTLTNDKYPQPGSRVTIVNARYVVTGEQAYDPAQKEWASGKLKLEMSFQMEAGDKAVGSAKGTMEASLAERK